MKFISPKRGDVFLVNFDPTVGREIKKTRPAVIIQNETGNKYGVTTIVAAITGNGKKAKKAPVSVLIRKGEASLTKDSLVLLHQIRTIDNRRLAKYLGTLSDVIMRKVNQELKVSLGL